MSQALPSLYKFVLIIQLLIGLLLTGAYGQTTSISDPNFEQDLVDQGIDSNGLTGNIVNSDAEAINTLNLLRTDITDLAGLEAFVNTPFKPISSDSKAVRVASGMLASWLSFRFRF
ncbi:MAG: hypothetical protein AAFN93_20515 [Bacteroidota bacterium]